ncbi:MULTISPECIES: hypothetical protein [Streptomyces]|uniref:hypothetical protein n=1 Tax=Streptomyces TaxID=1883 RepID=UPI00224E0F6A|nr:MULTISPECIES: hypothetical protein [Streptomyces]MCX4434874.1 hypothetical protein [Streptomyces mirabilis]
MTEQTSSVEDAAATPVEDATTAPVEDGTTTPVEVPVALPPAPEEAPAAAAPEAVPAVVDPEVPSTAVAPEVPPAPVRKDRRVLRALLRWTAATVVFAAVGTSVAYGITRMDRTDVPGLATESDGRWDYPTITRPPLPSGSPRPLAESNRTGTHYADLRRLVLPAPKGAHVDAALRGTDGWLATKTFLAEYATRDDRETVGQQLTDHGLRHIAARGWTTPDGTHTRIYLLQFDSVVVADEVNSPGLTSYSAPLYALRGAERTMADDRFPDRAAVDDVIRHAYDEVKPYGAEQVRQAYLSAGDTLALVVQSRKGAAKAVPFQQTVVLQSQLLG